MYLHIRICRDLYFFKSLIIKNEWYELKTQLGQDFECTKRMTYLVLIITWMMSASIILDGRNFVAAIDDTTKTWYEIWDRMIPEWNINFTESSTGYTADEIVYHKMYSDIISTHARLQRNHGSDLNPYREEELHRYGRMNEMSILKSNTSIEHAIPDYLFLSDFQNYSTSSLALP